MSCIEPSDGGSSSGPAFALPLGRAPGSPPQQPGFNPDWKSGRAQPPECGVGGVERVDDLAGVLDHPLHEEIDPGALAAEAADVGEQSDDSSLRVVRLHEGVEHADLA